MVCVLAVVVRLSSELTFLTLFGFVGWFSVVAIRVGISSLLFVAENENSSKKGSDAGCRSAAQIACRSEIGCGIKQKSVFLLLIGKHYWGGFCCRFVRKWL